MTNNDILRRLRYILNIKDTKIIKILSFVSYKVPLPRVVSWLKKEGSEDFTECSDKDLTAFLDGLIIEKRGRRENSKNSAIQQPQRLNNNLIFLKLKIAFNLKSDDVLELLGLAKYNISSSELSAFFRKKTHRHYRVCKDQILRKFLKGLQLKYTTETESSISTHAKELAVEPVQKRAIEPVHKQAIELKKSQKKPKKFSW